MLAGLDAEAAAALFARGTGGDAAPLIRDRLTELAAGNALALLELPSALTEAQLAGTEPLPEALPLTQQVEGVFLERLRRLSESRSSSFSSRPRTIPGASPSSAGLRQQVVCALTG